MATRSIKLKLVIDRKESGKELRQALWSTHEAVNRAAALCEEMLLACRGQGYVRGGDGEPVQVTDQEAKAASVKLARQVQAQNGKPGIGTDDEVAAALRRLYEAIIPSCLQDENGKPLKGDSQQAGAFWASILMDPESEGGLSVFDKVLEVMPPWVQAMEANQTGWEALSRVWLEGEDAKRLMGAAGSPAGWVRKLRAGQPWQELFCKDQEKKRKEAESGNGSLVQNLKVRLGILPLFVPPIWSKMAEHSAREKVTKWDRLAMRIAASHLLSWESWNHRTGKERKDALDALDKAQCVLTGFDAKLVTLLDGYQKTRHQQLQSMSLAKPDAPFRIGRRMLRSIDDVRRALSGNQPPRDALAALQTKLRGRFGDPDFYYWLADQPQELWKTPGLLESYVKRNALLGLVERRKESALYTLPDARLHPRWVQYGKLGDGNLKQFKLSLDGQELSLRIPLLREQDGKWVEQEQEFALAASGQFDPQEISREDGQSLSYLSGGQLYRALSTSGSDLLFDRRWMENRRPEDLSYGDIGGVWLKLVLDLELQAPAEWVGKNGKPVQSLEAKYFLSSADKKAEAPLRPGLRVMSVDLGLRSLAACSVFELKKGKPDKGLFYPADKAADLWACHERSFLLRLPGEEVSAGAEAGRQKARDELRELRRKSALLRELLRLTRWETAEERDKALAAFTPEQEWLSPGDVASLTSCLSLAPAVWEQALKGIYRCKEKEIGEAVRDWRRRTRPRPVSGADRRERRGYDGGKSAWHIEYLTDVRKFLQGWSLRGRSFGEINRMDRQKRGVFAAGLLEHINQMKDDRLATGADLLVQAARGMVYTENGWQQRHAPCRLILFEDLARYRFQTDRPRRENSQLMRWCHRSLLVEVEMQAELYGIGITTIGAGFTSQFSASTGAPGCRVRRLAQEDMASPYLLELAQKIAAEAGMDPQRLAVGSLVPWPGGEEFATLVPQADSTKKVKIVHADLNAAQNLQRRFWARHAELIRISVVEAKRGDDLVFYHDRDGKRLMGALGDYHAFAPTGEATYKAERVKKREWSKAVGTAAGKDEKEDSEADDELASLEAFDEVDATGKRSTLFRDPSGTFFKAADWVRVERFWPEVKRSLGKALQDLSVPAPKVTREHTDELPF